MSNNVIRVGSHPMNFSLFILRRRNLLEGLAQVHGWQVQWLDYPEGRQSSELLADNLVDWVGTGSTPPIYSQAHGVGVSYVAASASRPVGSALLVARDSGISNIEQLKSARVAATVGSYTDHFLARLLLDHGLSFQDIDMLDLPGRSGQEALAQGRVQAWAALEPLLGEQLAGGQVRCLAQVGEVIANRSLYWARSEWIERTPQQARLVYTALQDNDRWIAANIEGAAHILARHHDSGVDAAGWARSLASRDWGIEPAGPQVLAEQQEQARVLHAAGLLSAPLGNVQGIDLSTPEDKQ